jgi:CRISPR-associated protein Cmr4
MQSKILYIFTRTPLHVGAGASVGAIDQPVQRERHTGFPIIPGSSIKGVLADGNEYLLRDDNGKVQKDDNRNASARTDLGGKLFGLGAAKADNDNGQAGSIAFGEGQLLAFPVRSAKGCFAWLTSPLALMRWQRASGVTFPIPDTSKCDKAYFSEEQLGEKGTNATASALFEDYVFHHAGEFEAAANLATAIKVDGLWSDLAAAHLVLVSDDTLSHFVRTACEVAQHVVIDDETGTAKDGLLFNQENVPAETLFFATLHGKSAETLNQLTIPNPMQLGGDATTGLGFCSTLIV